MSTSPAGASGRTAAGRCVGPDGRWPAGSGARHRLGPGTVGSVPPRRPWLVEPERVVSDLPALRRLHRVWLAFVAIVVLLAGSLLLVELDPTSLPAALPAALAAVVGVAGLVTVVAIDRTFAAAPPATDRRALRGFEARQALQIAVGLAPAVLGTALAATLGSEAAAAIGVAGALAALVRARPTTTRLRRIEAAWAHQGVDVSARRAAGGIRHDDNARPPDHDTDPPASTPPND